MAIDKKEKKKKVDSYVLFKPYITRLFAYIVLVYLARNNYILFNENKSSYSRFLEILNEPLITDIKFVKNDESCPANYEPAGKTNFGSTYSGCNCDGLIIKSSQCMLYNKKQGLRECTENDKVKGVFRILNSEGTTTTENVGNSTILAKDECKVCYSNYTGLKEDLTIESFYSTQKPCLLIDKKQTTFTYLKSVGEECEEKHVCNMFFCRAQNSETNKCPVTTLVLNNTKSFYWNKTVFTTPFDFAEDFKKFSTYDSRNNPFIYLPLLQIKIGKNGVCETDLKYTSLYPLAKVNECQISSRYYEFDSEPLVNILKYNKHYDKVTQSLPHFLNYASNEVWQHNSRTAFAKDTLYCIANKYSLFKYNFFTKDSISDHLNEEAKHKQEEFAEKIYILRHLEVNVSFQESVQIIMIWLNVAITSFEVAYVLYKMFNICGDNFKCLLICCSYEGYISLTADIFIIVLAAYTHNVLSAFVHHLEEFIETGCLDEYVKGKMTVFRIASEVNADKFLEMFLILLTKFTIILISILYNCISKKGKVTCREVELLIFEKEEEEEEEEEEKPKKKRLRLRKSPGLEDKPIINEIELKDIEKATESNELLTKKDVKIPESHEK